MPWATTKPPCTSPKKASADGRRDCLLSGIAEVGSLLSASRTPPAEYLLLVDVVRDDITVLSDHLGHLGYANVPGAQCHGGWLFVAGKAPVNTG